MIGIKIYFLRDSWKFDIDNVWWHNMFCVLFWRIRPKHLFFELLFCIMIIERRYLCSNLINLLINFFLDLHHFLLLFKLSGFLFLVQCFFDQFVLRSLLIFKVFRQNWILWYDLNLFAHLINNNNILFSQSIQI